MLKRKGLKHIVLNAKYHAQEAEIVAQAGRKAGVTIATNMAGRGTDILLGGNPEYMARQQSLNEGVAEKVAKGEEKYVDDDEWVNFFHVDSFYRVKRADWDRIFSHFQRLTDEEHKEVVNLGGLHIIGTERHEARRIDNQLRGRAGRQGDPGYSRFYLSLEDSLMRLFASEKVANMMRRMGMERGEAIEHRMVTNSIEKAQRKVEGRNFDIRKQLLEYDDVANEQRKIIYQRRNELMEIEDISEVLKDMRTTVVNQFINGYIPPGSIDERHQLFRMALTVQPDIAAEAGTTYTTTDQDWIVANRKVVFPDPVLTWMPVPADCALTAVPAKSTHPLRQRLGRITRRPNAAARTAYPFSLERRRSSRPVRRGGWLRRRLWCRRCRH